jgi:raffinose synthase
MTVGAGITVADGNLMVLGKKVLSNVHDNVLVTPPSGGSLLNCAFIGVQSHQKGSRRVFPIGKLEYVLFSLCKISVLYFCFF